MRTNLPKFEGRAVQGATVRLTGSAHERIGCLSLDEDVYLVVRAGVARVTHQDGTGDLNGSFVRVHALKATEVYVIDSDEGKRMLSEAAMLADERFGIKNLFTKGDDEDE